MIANTDDSDFNDILHRVLPTTSAGWFKIGLIIAMGKLHNGESESSSDEETLDVESPCMRRNADSFCSVISGGSSTV